MKKTILLLSVVVASFISACNLNGMYDDPQAYAVAFVLEEYSIVEISGIESEDIYSSNEGYWVKVMADSLQFEVFYDKMLETSGQITEQKISNEGVLIHLIPITAEIINNPPIDIGLVVKTTKQTGECDSVCVLLARK
jgi:hypothetical protein